MSDHIPPPRTKVIALVNRETREPEAVYVSTDPVWRYVPEEAPREEYVPADRDLALERKIVGEQRDAAESRAELAESRVAELEAELRRAWRHWPPEGPERTVLVLYAKNILQASSTWSIAIPSEVLYRELEEAGDG